MAMAKNKKATVLIKIQWRPEETEANPEVRIIEPSIILTRRRGGGRLLFQPSH